MGCFYSSDRTKQSAFTSLSTSTPSLSFSHSNESYFLVPKNYSLEISQLKEIIIDDPTTWKNKKNFLSHLKRHFQDKIQSISWFLATQKLEESSKMEQDSINSGYLANPSSHISNKSIAISSTQKILFFDHFPFIKHCEPSNFKTRLIIEIDSIICTRKLFSQHPLFEKPFIEIEIHSFNDSDLNEEKTDKTASEIIRLKTIFTPKLQGKNLDWKEVISHEIQNSTEFDQGFFSITLYFYNKTTKKREMVGENYIFSLSELQNQMVTEKIINVRNEDDKDVYCYILFRCQLVYDYLSLLLFWKSDLEVKMEVIKRIISRNENKKKQIHIIQKSKSLIFNERKYKEDLQMMMESFQTAFAKTMNLSMRNERVSFKEAYQKTFANRIDSMISQNSSVLLNQSIYYDNKYYLA